MLCYNIYISCINQSNLIRKSKKHSSYLGDCKNLQNLENFIHSGENFRNKKILILSIYKEKDSLLINRFRFSSKEKIFFHNISKQIHDNFSINLSQIPELIFDYIFIDLGSSILNKNIIKDALMDLKKYLQSGSRIFLLIKNKRNLFYVLKNLLSFSFDYKSYKYEYKIISFYNFLLYDYCYLFNFKKFSNKQNLIYKIIIMLKYLTKKINFQRFNFIASHILIKYSYISS